MSKHKIWIAVLIFALLLVYPAGRLLVIVDDVKVPGFVSDYAKSGDFTFDPETILVSINQGETNIFTPFDGSPDDLPIHNSVDWTPADYLKITDLLSQQIWNEPLNLDGWDVYRVYFESECKDNLQGFEEFSIVYYKSMEINDWERKYDVRVIDIFAWQGFIRWGGDTIFSAPVLSAWHDINWLKFEISPVNAMRITDQNGGKEERGQVQDVCSLMVGMYQDRPGIWEVSYPQAYFRMDVNANNGAYKIQYAGH